MSNLREGARGMCAASFTFWRNVFPIVLNLKKKALQELVFHFIKRNTMHATCHKFEVYVTAVLQAKPDTIVEVWRGNSTVPWQHYMTRIASQGYKTILSSCWYLNYISYGQDWRKYYQCEPQNFTGECDETLLVKRIVLMA